MRARECDILTSTNEIGACFSNDPLNAIEAARLAPASYVARLCRIRAARAAGKSVHGISVARVNSLGEIVVSFMFP